MTKLFIYIVCIGLITGISCKSNKFDSPSHDYSIQAPEGWRQMTDEEKYGENIPDLAIADIALINEKACIVKEAGLMKNRIDTIPMYALCHFFSGTRCKLAMDSTIMALSLDREVKTIDKKQEDTFLGSLISGDCYVDPGKMIIHMDKGPFDRFVADVYLDDGLLSIFVFAYYQPIAEVRRKELNDLMYIIHSLELKPDRYCSVD